MWLLGSGLLCTYSRSDLPAFCRHMVRSFPAYHLEGLLHAVCILLRFSLPECDEKKIQLNEAFFLSFFLFFFFFLDKSLARTISIIPFLTKSQPPNKAQPKKKAMKRRPEQGKEVSGLSGVCFLRLQRCL